jgi:hypothetical protein
MQTEDDFCDVAPCSLVDIDKRFRAVYCLHHQGDERIGYSIIQTFETVLVFYTVGTY